MGPPLVLPVPNPQQIGGDRLLRLLVRSLPVHRAGLQGALLQVHRRRVRQDRRRRTVGGVAEVERVVHADVRAGQGGEGGREGRRRKEGRARGQDPAAHRSLSNFREGFVC